MHNEFTAREAELIALHLSDYLDSPSLRETIPDELREALCRSASEKLANLSPMTYFSQQEYAVMFFAVQHFADVVHANGDVLPGEAYRLLDKLYTKAGG